MDRVQKCTESVGNANSLNCVDVLPWSTEEDDEDEGEPVCLVGQSGTVQVEQREAVFTEHPACPYKHRANLRDHEGIK